MRPNLMSPRRPTTSGEDSILAMLEREPARKRARGTSGVRLAWYGASAAAVLALTGTLIWMAANNDGLRPDVKETVLAEATAGRSTAPVHPAGAAMVLRVAMAPAPEAQPAGAAVIVDQPAPGQAIPPLRLLKPAPEKAVAETPAPEKPAPAVRATASPPVPAMAPAKPVARSLPPARPAAAPAEPRALARPAAAPPRPGAALAAKQAAKAAQAKAQRGAHPARTAQAPVDADVALISAVIVHANGHAPEGSQMTELLCPNDSCQTRPSRQ
ncbi:hypothetical protein [Massilia sp. BSC265]|uniref:hypothetical protein n=1 Tax=Massilia sp. BSC265 TaxID=1549812 RepID=UPI0006918523|nr:hypothetical protein [Massilia sp. BSC265]